MYRKSVSVSKSGFNEIQKLYWKEIDFYGHCDEYFSFGAAFYARISEEIHVLIRLVLVVSCTILTSNVSGSPILQNGKLVGAVTHVMVDEPRQGYGIWIGDMLEAAG